MLNGTHVQIQNTNVRIRVLGCCVSLHRTRFSRCMPSMKIDEKYSLLFFIVHKMLV